MSTRKTFRDYYQDEEFKRKHLAKMKEKIECECGKFITRSNMAAHKKTNLHLKRSVKKRPEVPEEIEDRIINKLINQFKLELKST